MKVEEISIRDKAAAAYQAECRRATELAEAKRRKEGEVRSQRCWMALKKVLGVEVDAAPENGEIEIDGLLFRFVDGSSLTPGTLRIVGQCDKCEGEELSEPIDTITDIGKWLAGEHCRQHTKEDCSLHEEEMSL